MHILIDCLEAKEKDGHRLFSVVSVDGKLSLDVVMDGLIVTG